MFKLHSNSSLFARYCFVVKVVKFVFGTAKDILEHTIYDIANNFHKSFKEDSDNRYKRGHDDFYDQYKDHK